MIIPIIVAILAIAASGFAFYWFFMRKKNSVKLVEKKLKTTLETPIQVQSASPQEIARLLLYIKGNHPIDTSVLDKLVTKDEDPIFLDHLKVSLEILHYISEKSKGISKEQTFIEWERLGHGMINPHDIRLREISERYYDMVILKAVFSV